MPEHRRGWRILAGGSRTPGLFEEFLVPQIDALYGLALRLTKDADAAADLLQDTALRAFEKFDQLRERGAARAWLIRILSTTFLNHYAGRHGCAPTGADRPEEEEPVASETPESLLLRRSDAQQVEEALAALPQDFRLTVLLADVEELTLREIAVICGCPVGTVASRLARGRKLLRERLRHLGGVRQVDA